MLKAPNRPGGQSISVGMPAESNSAVHYREVFRRSTSCSVLGAIGLDFVGVASDSASRRLLPGDKHRQRQHGGLSTAVA
jgi:hypothetical protein